MGHGNVAKLEAFLVAEKGNKQNKKKHNIIFGFGVHCICVFTSIKANSHIAGGHRQRMAATLTYLYKIVEESTYI